MIEFLLISYEQNTIESFSSNNVSDILEKVDHNRFSWLTINNYSDSDRATIEQILTAFAIDTSLADDMLDHILLEFTGEHPDYLYLEYAVPLFNPQTKDYDQAKGSVILGHRYLLSFVETNLGLFNNTRQKILAHQTRVQQFGPDYLLYLFIRAAVINVERLMFVDLVQQFEIFEDEVIASAGKDTILDGILALREQVKPLYDSVRRLGQFIEYIREEDSRFITPQTSTYFQMNLEQDMQALWNGYFRLRTWTSELMDIHRANVNEKTNRIIHILTIISTVFLPITFISSLYGMNFENMPELNQPYAYPSVLILMTIIVVVMVIYMKRKKWF